MRFWKQSKQCTSMALVSFLIAASIFTGTAKANYGTASFTPECSWSITVGSTGNAGFDCFGEDFPAYYGNQRIEILLVAEEGAVMQEYYVWARLQYECNFVTVADLGLEGSGVADITIFRADGDGLPMSGYPPLAFVGYGEDDVSEMMEQGCTVYQTSSGSY